MDSTEVTQSHFEEVMGFHNTTFTGPQNPATNVNWFDALLFCNARSLREKLDTVYVYDRVQGTPGRGATLLGLKVRSEANGYRLATSDEWEFAARAGRGTDYPWGKHRYNYPTTPADSQELGENALWVGNIKPSHHLIGLKKGPNPQIQTASRKPNAYGVYDMLGGVWEWCYDCIQRKMPKNRVHTKKGYGRIGTPEGPCAFRVERGGSWFNVLGLVSNRDNLWDNFAWRRNGHSGFRCVRSDL